MLHRFSMGFKSGEFPGQTPFPQTVGKVSFKRSIVSFAVCAGAPSCMNVTEAISGGNICNKCIWEKYRCSKQSVRLEKKNPVYKKFCHPMTELSIHPVYTVLKHITTLIKYNKYLP